MPRTATDLPPSTPTRRSKRFQPTATPSKRRDATLNCSWTSDPIYVRPTNSSLDFLPDEQDETDINNDADARDDDDDDVADGGEDSRGRRKAISKLETVFFDSFMMSSNKPKQYRSSTKSGLGQTIYRVGDTILVETDTLYRVKKPPSVAVITAMWETRTIRNEIYEEVDELGTRSSGTGKNIRIRVHWFLRPTELAAVRLKRNHEDNEVYYTINSSAVIVPDSIISKCKVSSTLTGSWEEEEKAAGNYTFESIPKTPELRSSAVFKKKPSASLIKSTRKSDGSWTRSPIPHSPTKLKTSTSRKGGKGQRYATPSNSEGSDSEDELPLPIERLFTSVTKDNEDDLVQFYCHLAIDSQRGLYFTFEWKSHLQIALDLSAPPEEQNEMEWGDGAGWNVVPTRRRKQDDTLSTIEEEHEHESDESPEKIGEDSFKQHPRTPSRKRKHAAIKTPRKSDRRKSETVVHPTPHSRLRQARSRAKKKVKSFPSILHQRNSELYDTLQKLKDPWTRALHVLHVGSRPEMLPCREDEYKRILRCVGELVEEGSGGCVYISGVPGTGKTATVHTVVRELKRLAEAGETNPFTYVEINGLRLSEPSTAYSLLWEAVSGHDTAREGHLKISAKESLKALTRYFAGGGRGPGGHACVVLMDELDQLVTTKQDVVYNFFNWPTMVGSKLVVIAVANTMDLPERVMTGRVRSRLGMIRINFQPYSTSQLVEIVQARLESAKDGLQDPEKEQVIIAPDGIKLAAMSVSSISGDARRVLDICRRAVELVRPLQKTAKAPDVKQVTQVMQKSPTAVFLRECSFHERVMLASMMKCMKRDGVEEIKWGDIQYQHLIYLPVLAGRDDSQRKPTHYEFTLILDSLVASRALIVEEGHAIAKKPAGERRVLLNLEMSEVERVLSEVGGSVWKSVLST
ncbi:hypothetical protein BDQ17DRAFT_1340381 [Cyathus striatus]|nr:hypothetical protein BDQ17DRAFT_1340381 [Cyathus striatus]